MSKLFIFSDCHGYADELKNALNNAGFDPNNENHWIIGLGDYLDRGRQPQEIINYLMSLPRKILCKGNHEELLLDMINRGHWLSHDYSNGTFNTVLDLVPNAKTFDVACAVAYDKIKDFIGCMVDYVETKSFIGVHAFIPLVNKDGLPAHYVRNRKFGIMENWREASATEWNDARWGNPFDLAEKGFNQTGKTIVFGHWATEHKWAEVERRKDFDENAKHDIYYGEGYIGIDATTAYSGKVNVLVLEDEFLNG